MSGIESLLRAAGLGGALALGFCACGQVADGSGELGTSGDTSIAGRRENPSGGAGGSGSVGGSAQSGGVPSLASGGSNVVVVTGGSSANGAASGHAECGVAWRSISGPSPAQGLVGTFNGEPFEIAPEDLRVGLDCPSPEDRPPELFLSFELKSEQSERLLFMVRHCAAFVYLPDLSALDLTLDADVAIERRSDPQSSSPAVGHIVLRAAATATTPEMVLEFDFSSFVGGPTTVCVG